MTQEKKITKLTRGDIAQLLPKPIERGLIYKTRHGTYALAIPMFRGFIKRQFE